MKSWLKDLAVSVVGGVITYLITTYLPYFGQVASSSVLYVPAPLAAAFVIAILILVIFVLVRIIAGKKSESILDHQYGRRIAVLCQNPRDTAYLKQQYEIWERQSRVVIIGGYQFNDFLNLLQKQGYLKYSNGAWQSTSKAAKELKKYHGYAD
jgi:hypothetical protein